MRFLSAACFLSLLYSFTGCCACGYATFPDARAAIRATYHPPFTPDQTGAKLENFKYYPYHLYWESKRTPLPFLHTLLPEAASDYELAATYSVFQEPESSIALRGNKLYWAVTAQGTNIPYYVNSAPLWKGRWITILRDHLPACFPSETFPSWLHPYLDLVEARMYDDIARRLQQEYSRNYVLRGVAVLPPALAQELKTTWKECLETAVLDLPVEAFESCDQGWCYYSATPGLVATELQFSRRTLPLKRQMFHIFRILFDAASMNDFTPGTQRMLMKLCADARSTAAEMKKAPPHGISISELMTNFFPPFPDDGYELWEGKNPPLRHGKSLKEDTIKECMALPLSRNPVWKDLFPNTPEDAAAWMHVYPEGPCCGAFIHQGFLHVATTELGLPFYRMHDFSRMDNPPSMSPYELWWDGTGMRVQRFFLKLEPAAEKELKTYLRLLARSRSGKKLQETFPDMLFRTDLGKEGLIQENPEEGPGQGPDDDPDSLAPGISGILTDIYRFRRWVRTDYFQEGSEELEQLRKDRRELERYLGKHFPAKKADAPPATQRGAQKP